MILTGTKTSNCLVLIFQVDSPDRDDESLLKKSLNKCSLGHFLIAAQDGCEGEFIAANELGIADTRVQIGEESQARGAETFKWSRILMAIHRYVLSGQCNDFQ